MTIQSQLFIKTHKVKSFKSKNAPSHLLNWEDTKPSHKRFLLLQVIRAVTEHSQEYMSIDKISIIINKNTAIKSQNRTGIIKEQLKLYIENLIYLGFIDDSYSNGLVLNDKIYDELQSIDTIISGNSGEVE